MATLISVPSWSPDTLPGSSLLLFFMWILGVSSFTSCADLNWNLQIPFSLKGISERTCLRSQALWKRSLENTRSSHTVTLAQNKPRGQHWNILPPVDLRIGAGDQAIKSVHSYSSCRNCFSSHTDRERSQVKFYGPFSWLLLPNFLDHKNNSVCFIT